MATIDRSQRKKVKRYRPIPNDIKAELVRRGLSVREIARRYGVSHYVIGRILSGYQFKTHRGIWKSIKKQLLKDFPWLKHYIS